MLHYSDTHMDVHIGDCREVLRTLKADSVHCVVTSPPYWGLRDYGVAGALGLESTPEAFIASMVEVFREVRRVLRRDGTLWLNMGDSFDTKQLVGMPWRLAFALQADGWYLRSDIIWAKPNPMPESVTDRPTKSHEYVFLLTKSARYFYDAEAVRSPGVYTAEQVQKQAAAHKRRAENGRSRTGAADFGDMMTNVEPYGTGTRNLRSVWQIATEPYPGAHFATFPQKLVEPCIKAGTSERGVCPECGAPWVREVERPEEPDGLRNRGNGAKMDYHTRQTGGGQKIQDWMDANPKTTVDWRPTCQPSSSCSLGSLPVPATVLDPFAGSGTTGLVANRLGRRAILIDLSADYIDQAMLRNQQHPLGLIG